MIVSFRHKGLEELFETGYSSRLPQERLKKIRMLLAVLDGAEELRDLNLPALRFHRLRKPPLDGFYSIDVTGNYRVVFVFDKGKVTELNYLDTH
jgi:toxin HigB-1